MIGALFLSKKKFFISVGVFILIGAILFGIIQNVLAQTWNRPYFAENLTSSLRTFYSQEDNVDQVLFLEQVILSIAYHQWKFMKIQV